MKIVNKNTVQPDKRLAAACGLFCPSCWVYIATRETPEKREKVARDHHVAVEALNCDGCRSANRTPYCQTCKMAACVAEQGIDFCGECAEYPCDDLKTFQAAKPHRIELWQTQARIQEVGYEQWFAEKLEHYACPQCGTLNSAYHLACRECGAVPSCAYVAEHREQIVAYLAKRNRAGGDSA
jgi:hypothetical protein